ncbi:hypothetical protein RJ641_012843 [Dillenia turbinata]|uniref:Uncharacterized protein n=1 Tax=Dillenia turbinata TaxID=194707 RepID=A0AAN8Z2M3_9MAGN
MMDNNILANDSHRLENGVEVHYAGEEESKLMRELAVLCRRLKFVTSRQPLLNNNRKEAGDDFYAEVQDREGEVQISDGSLQQMMNESSKCIKSILDERLETEGAIRDLHAILSKKDHEIEDLHAKVSELSVPRDVVDSSVSSNDIEAIVDRMVASLAVVIGQGELMDDSLSSKISHVEKSISQLVEINNQFISYSNYLGQCLAEGESDFNVQDFGSIFWYAGEQILELRRKESEFVDNLRHSEDENRRLVEQIEENQLLLEKMKVDIERTKAELEQEKGKYANTKEKLSLAVTKGKALVQQRDLLKQSLAEKTNELEKCLIELKEKSTAVEAAELAKEELLKSENLISSLQQALSQRDEFMEKLEQVLSQTSTPEGLQPMDYVKRLEQLVDERNMLKDVSAQLQNLTAALHTINVPESLSSSNFEDRVSWLGESISHAKAEINRLQEEIAAVQEHAKAERNMLYDQAAVVREAANKEISRLTASLSTELQEKDYYRMELDELVVKHEKLVQQEHQVSLEKDQLVNVLLRASGISLDNEEGLCQSSYDVSVLVDKCLGRIIEKSDASFENSHVLAEQFEKIRSLLYIRDHELVLCEKILEEEMAEKLDLTNLSNELSMASQEITSLKVKNDALQKDLEKAEEKSALLREKLSMAVKKGKGLVQDRENLKLQIDEKNSEIEKLKLELKQLESAFGECRVQLNQLSVDVERIPQLEADLASIKEQRDQLSGDLERTPQLETDLSSIKEQRDQLEHFLVESNNVLQRVIEAIDGIAIPVDADFKEPVEKVNWLSKYVSECKASKVNAEKELENAKEEVSTVASKLAEVQSSIRSLEYALAVSEDNISRLSKEKRELEESSTLLEQELQKATNDASSHASKFSEASVAIKSLEDAISALIKEKENAHASRDFEATELEKVKREVTIHQTKLSEAHMTIKTMEEALSQLESHAALVAEEKSSAEMGRASLESEINKLKLDFDTQSKTLADAQETVKSLEKALVKAEQNSSLSVHEKESAEKELLALNSKVAACVDELNKMKEDFDAQSKILAGTQETVKSLEEALLKAEQNASISVHEKESVQQEVLALNFKLTACVDELSKMREDFDAQSKLLADTQGTVKSLEEALMEAEENASLLVHEKESAQQEVLELNSKLTACTNELAGTDGNFENRSLELLDHLNSLRKLDKDDHIFSMVKQNFKKKFERLRDMDLLLRNLETHFADVGRKSPQDHLVIEEDSHLSKLFSVDVENIMNLEMNNGEVTAADRDNIPLYLSKIVEGFHLKDKALAEKFERLSTLADEFFSHLLEELQATKDSIVVTVDQVESLKQNVETREKYMEALDKKIALLENDCAILLSACEDTTRELEAEVDNNPMELSFLAPDVGDVDRDAAEQHQIDDSSKYVKAADKLLFSARQVQTLVDHLRSEINVSVITIQELQDELNQSRMTSEKAIKERDQGQELVTRLEKDMEALRSLCSEMRLKLEDHKAKDDKLGEREAELSLLQNSLLRKEEVEQPLLSASQVKSLGDRINGNELSSAKLESADAEPNDSLYVKFSCILDNFDKLQDQIGLLSSEKKELQSALDAQLLETEHLKGEVANHLEVKQDLEKTQSELYDVEAGLEKIVLKFGGNGLAEDQNISGVKGILPVLEKMVMAIIMESENSKSKVEELGVKLLGSQNVVDELSNKVKILEDSIQNRSSPPDAIRDRSIFEATSSAAGSEISEIEDVGSLGKKAISPVPSAAHVRLMRKGSTDSTDHLVLNIDSESNRLINNVDTDEDKGHVFKSLNTSGLIPVQGKVIADRIDGIWVSSGRLLSSRPGARLGLIAYCLLLHLWLLGTIL